MAGHDLYGAGSERQQSSVDKNLSGGGGGRRLRPFACIEVQYVRAAWTTSRDDHKHLTF